MAFNNIEFASITYKMLSNNKESGTILERVQKTFTANGNAQLDTNIVKYGTASGLFDGNGDYIRTLNFTDAANTNTNFTLEFWARFNILPSNQTIGGGAYMTFMFSETASSISTEPYYNLNNLSLSYGIVNPVGGAVYGNWSWSESVEINTWYHFAIVRNNGVSVAYRNGIAGTQNGTAVPSTALFVPSSGRFSIGGWYQQGRGYWDGNIDEVRFSFGARYTSNFTPPTDPFLHDDTTMLLLHMDGSNGSTTFTDSIS